MKQIITSPPRPKIPSIAAQLREMQVGEKAFIIATGSVYNTFMASRSKLHRDDVGRWEHEMRDEGRKIIVTRTA